MMGLERDYLSLEKPATALWKRQHLYGVQRVNRIWIFGNEGQKEDCQCGSLRMAEATCMDALSTPCFVLNCAISMLEGGKKALICCYVFCLI